MIITRRRISCRALIIAAFCGPTLSACTLPYEQLSLPSAILSNGSNPDAPGGPKKSGNPLSGPGAQETTENRTFLGTGEYSRNNVQPKAAGESPAGGAGGSQVTKDGITLNLVGASVPEVAKTVLGDVLGVNYVVSEKVKANITLRTVRPVDKSGLLEIFESVLRAEGAALVVEGGLYKIVPAADAVAGGTPLRSKARALAGITTAIVPLRYVAAPEMERILKSAAPQAGILRVDTARNLLVLSGTPAELASMNEMVNVFDVDWMKGMSFGIYPVETSDPDAIAGELDTIFANDKDSPTKGIVRFIGNKRLKSVLVISSRPEYLRKAEKWLERIDMASRATEKQVFVYHVQHRPARELAALMQKVYSGKDGSRGGSGLSRLTGGGSSSSDSISTTSLSTSSGTGSGTGSGTSSGAGGGSFQAPSIQAPSQPGFGSSSQDTSKTGSDSQQESVTSGPTDTGHPGSGSGAPPDDRSSGISIVADEPNNSLVITATAAEYHRMLRMLQSVDIMPNQVLIEATIAEVTLNDNLKFGVRWFLTKGGNDISLSDAAQTPINTPLSGGFNYLLRGTNLQVALNALSTVTNVDVISTPTLTVVENKKAVLQVGDEVPILTQSATSTITTTPAIVNSVSYRDTGVILGITPRVSDNGRVVLDIEQEVSTAVQTTTAQISSPTIQQRRVKTTVSVNDGEGIVLAGLVQDNSNRSRDQVPILGDLAVIGNAFKSKTDTITRTELVIAITPQVIKDSNQIDAITAEFRNQLNLSTRPQRRGPPDTREQIDRIVR